MWQVWKSVIFVEWYFVASEFAESVPRGPEVRKLKNLGPIFFITTYLGYARHYR